MPWAEVLYPGTPKASLPLCQYGITSGWELQDSSSPLVRTWPTYVSNLLEMLVHLPPSYMDIQFRVRFGDCVEPAPFPLVSKARTIGDEEVTLLPLNVDRHFDVLFQDLVADSGLPYDYPFWDKVPKVFWRGATTDHGWDPTLCMPYNHRRCLIETWASSEDPRADVGLHALVQEANTTAALNHWKRYLKPFKAPRDQLIYRYLPAVEGNDVATGLKWMLASNSVVLMPTPRRETWSLESRLKPWEHYIPVNEDFSDLLHRVEWCEEHLTDCIAIAERATAYIRRFANRTRMFQEGATRLRDYLDRMNDINT